MGNSNMTNESAWIYFSGQDGSKFLYFRETSWPMYLLFSILIIGAMCNVFLVSKVSSIIITSHEG